MTEDDLRRRRCNAPTPTEEEQRARMFEQLAVIIACLAIALLAMALEGAL